MDGAADDEFAFIEHCGRLIPTVASTGAVAANTPLDGEHRAESRVRDIRAPDRAGWKAKALRQIGWRTFVGWPDEHQYIAAASHSEDPMT